MTIKVPGRPFLVALTSCVTDTEVSEHGSDHLVCPVQGRARDNDVVLRDGGPGGAG